MATTTTIVAALNSPPSELSYGHKVGTHTGIIITSHLPDVFDHLSYKKKTRTKSHSQTVAERRQIERETEKLAN